MSTHVDKLKGIAELLLQRETINQNDLIAVAGPRPWGINQQLKQYVELMYDERTGDKPAADGAASGATTGPSGEEGGDKGKSEERNAPAAAQPA